MPTPELTDLEKGQHLKAFFWSLLADGEKMAVYQTPNTRTTAIEDQHPEIQDILENGTLKEIEEFISLTASGNPTSAWPTVIVWPPM